MCEPDLQTLLVDIEVFFGGSLVVRVVQVLVVEICLVLFYSVDLDISPCTTSFGQGFVLVSVSGVVLLL